MTCGNGSAGSPSPALPVTPRRCARTPTATGVTYATKLAMQTLGRRVLDIDADCAHLHGELTRLVRATAPSLLELPGVGIHTAALLLVAAGDNAERISSEAAFAHLCGVAPIHASSGKTVRHRLNRGGNRQANHALWRIVFTRMGSDPRTRAYVERRLAEGRSKPEIMRVLKRYVAREVYRHLPRALAPRSSGGSGPRNASTPPRLSCERSADPPLHPSIATPPGLIRACPRARVAHHWSAGTVAKIDP